jgi:hypothetical protein
MSNKQSFRLTTTTAGAAAAGQQVGGELTFPGVLGGFVVGARLNLAAGGSGTYRVHLFSSSAGKVDAGSVTPTDATYLGFVDLGTAVSLGTPFAQNYDARHPLAATGTVYASVELVTGSAPAGAVALTLVVETD